MSIANYALAEAYVMRKNHQEKMKTTTFDAQGTAKRSKIDNDDIDRATSTIGCFPTLFKKIHPAMSSTKLVQDSSHDRHSS